MKNLYEKYKDCKLRCGEDDEGYALRVRLGNIFEYIMYNRDDSPLYLFESQIDNPKRGVTDMINDYTVPKYFEDDYYKLIGDDARPPHRWVLIGSK